jgi:hypothetical protein
MKMHEEEGSVDQTTLRKEELTVNSAHENMTVQSRPAVQAAVHKSRKFVLRLDGAKSQKWAAPRPRQRNRRAPMLGVRSARRHREWNMGHRRVQPLPVLRKLGVLCLTHRAVQGMLDDALSRLGISLLEQKRTRHGDGGCPRCMHGDARTVFVRDVGRKNYQMQREKHVALAAGQGQRGLAALSKAASTRAP